MKQDSKATSDTATVTPCGAVVRSLRNSAGLTLEALVNRTVRLGGQVSKRKLQQIEKSEPTRLTIIGDVAQSLGVSSNVLLFDIVDAAHKLIGALYLDRDNDSLQLNRSLLAHDITIFMVGDPNTIPFAGTYTGIEGVGECLARLFSVIEPRGADPRPDITNVSADYRAGTVVIDLENDVVRLRRDPSRTLICKVKCTFRFKDGKLIYFEDLFDTAAWERFLS